MAHIANSSSQNQFLVEENEQLKDQVQQLQHMLMLNKQALSIAMNNNGNGQPQQQSTSNRFQQSNGKHINDEQSLNSKSQNTDRDKQAQALNKVISSLYEENNNNLNQIKKLTEERNIAQSKSLVHEQIYEETLRQKQELVDEMNDKIQGLNQHIEKLDIKIHKLEKEKPVYDQISGVVVKYREVANVNQQTMLLHEEQERLNYIIVKQAKEISKFKNECENLTKLNYELSQSLVAIKTRSYLPGNQNNIGQQINIPQLNLNQQSFQQEPQQNINVNLDVSQMNEQDENPLDKSAMMLMNLHKKIMDGGKSDDSETDIEEIEQQCLSPLMENLPDKVNIGKQQQNNGLVPPMGLNLPLKGNNGQQVSDASPNKPVLKQLDLTKAFQIQDMNAKRSTQIQLQKQGGENNIMIIKDRVKKLENQLNESRKNLAREMLQNKTLQLENDQFKSRVQELEGKHDILINSYNIYEQKWRDIFHAFNFYKEFYREYKDELGKGRLDTRVNMATELTEQSPEKIIRQRKRQNNENMMDRSILDANIGNQQQYDQQQYVSLQQQCQDELQQAQVKHANQQDLQFQKQSAQNYLLGMAADLYNHMNNFDNLQQNRQKYSGNGNTTTTRRVRSNSNPIDYIPVQEDVYKQGINANEMVQQAVKQNVYDNNNNANNNKSTLPQFNFHKTGKAIVDIDDMDNVPDDIRE